MPYDLVGALSAGASPEELQTKLKAAGRDVDLVGALNAGADPRELQNRLNTPKAPMQDYTSAWDIKGLNQHKPPIPQSPNDDTTTSVNKSTFKTQNGRLSTAPTVNKAAISDEELYDNSPVGALGSGLKYNLEKYGAAINEIALQDEGAQFFRDKMLQTEKNSPALSSENPVIQIGTKLLSDPLTYAPVGIFNKGARALDLAKSTAAGIGIGAGITAADELGRKGEIDFTNLAIGGGIGGTINATIALATRGKINLSNEAINKLTKVDDLLKKEVITPEQAAKIIEKDTAIADGLTEFIEKSGRAANDVPTSQIDDVIPQQPIDDIQQPATMVDELQQGQTPDLAFTREAPIRPMPKQAQDVSRISEDATAQAVKNMFVKQPDSQYKNMTNNDRNIIEENHAMSLEADRVRAESEIIPDNENVFFAKGADNLAAGTLAGVEEDENGNITLDPEKFIMGLGGYTVAKKLLTHPTVTKEMKDYIGRALNDLDTKPYAQYVTGEIPMFAGEKAKNADLGMLSKAKAMTTKGINEKDIWKDTGWMLDKDGKWKFEIDDSVVFFKNDSYVRNEANAKDINFQVDGVQNKLSALKSQYDGIMVDATKSDELKYKVTIRYEQLLAQGTDEIEKIKRSAVFIKPSMGNGKTIGEIIEHDELFAKYPQFSKTKVVYDDSVGAANEAYYNGREIVLSPKIKNIPLDDAKSIILHELQHKTQDVGGFARGGAPEEFLAGKRKVSVDEYNNAHSQYRNIHGEAEARNVQSRINMTAKERRASFPHDTFDVPANQTIVKFDGSEAMSMRNPKEVVKDFYKSVKVAKRAVDELSNMAGTAIKNNFKMNESYVSKLQDKHVGLAKDMNRAMTIHKAMSEMSLETNMLLQRFIVNDIDKMPKGYEHFEKLGNVINADILRQSKELLDLNMISQKVFDDYKGNYVKRLFDKHWFQEADNIKSAGKGIPKTYQRGDQLDTSDVDEAFEYLSRYGKAKGLPKLSSANSDIEELYSDASKKGYFGEKIDGKVATKIEGKKFSFDRDWTKGERESMGEIENAALTVPNTLATMSNTIQTARMFKEIASDPKIVYQGLETDEAIIKELGYLRIPTSKKYGLLAGKFVTPDVMKDITYMSDINKLTETWLKYLSLWKQSRTVWNMGAHVYNFGSNIILRFMAGENNPFANMQESYDSLRAVDEIETILAKRMAGTATKEENATLKKLLAENKYIMEARDIGLFGRSELNDVLKNFGGSDAFKNKKGVLTKVNEATQKLYSGGDNVVRMAMYITKREKGVAPTTAQREIGELLPDYTKPLPRAIRMLRDTGVAPFISWSYYVLPNIMRLAKAKPGRALAVLGMTAGLSEMAMQLQGSSNLDLPSDAIGRRLGINVDEEGNTDTLKVDRFLPGYDIAAIPISSLLSGIDAYMESDRDVTHTAWESAKGGWSAFRNFMASTFLGGQIPKALVAIMTGKDSYSGRDVQGNKASQTDGDEILNIASWIHDTFGITPVQLTNMFKFVQSEIQDPEERKKFSDTVPRTTTQGALKLMGVNTMTYDTSQTEKKKEKAAKHYEKLFGNE